MEDMRVPWFLVRVQSVNEAEFLRQGFFHCVHNKHVLHCKKALKLQM